MRLEVQLGRQGLRRWHLGLLGRLAARPNLGVTLRWVEGAGVPLPGCVGTLFALERLIHALPEGSAAPTSPAEFARFGPSSGVAAPDLVLDLSGEAVLPASVRSWRLTFDGVVGEAAALGALLAGRPPVVAVTDAHTGAAVTGGRPGSETPGVIVVAFEDLLAGAAALIEGALDGASARPQPYGPALASSCRRAARHGAFSLARAATHRLYRLLYRAPHWRTGWRFVGEGPDVIDLGGHPGGGWRDLPDDGLHFYADPFPITVDGRTWLFVEDFDHRLGRGALSAVEFGAEGPLGSPRPVMESDVHLSYPCVFAHAGEVWMVPESVGARRVDLFRATRFPGGWVREATLLDDIEASDATPFRHRGRWWMLATVRNGGSYSDALHLWSAPALAGPWRPHPGNPVLVDIAAARPAGHVVARGDRLIRPVQDNRAGYGAALALAAITRLDDEGFAQEVTARIGPGPAWPGRRLHTLNRADRLECIDGSALSRRVPRLRPAAARD